MKRYLPTVFNIEGNIKPILETGLVLIRKRIRMCNN